MTTFVKVNDKYSTIHRTLTLITSIAIRVYCKVSTYNTVKHFFAQNVDFIFKYYFSSQLHYLTNKCYNKHSYYTPYRVKEVKVIHHEQES